MMWYGGDGWGWGGWILMTVGMVAFWALVITAIVVGDSRHTTRPPVSGATRAEDLLHERFARGEIDEDEYRQRMALLRDHR
jgi:putative membrane protein